MHVQRLLGSRAQWALDDELLHLVHEVMGASL